MDRLYVEQTTLSRPTQFLDRLHANGLKTSLNMHPASGVQPWEDAYPAMAKAMGVDPATRKYVPFDITDKKIRDQLHGPSAPSSGEARHRFLVARLAAGANHEAARRQPNVVAQLCALH